jgi:hypothetical protein
LPKTLKTIYGRGGGGGGRKQISSRCAETGHREEARGERGISTHWFVLRLTKAHFSPFMSSSTTSPGPITGTLRFVGTGGGGAPTKPPSSNSAATSPILFVFLVLCVCVCVCR